jgi:hypothetical protein
MAGVSVGDENAIFVDSGRGWSAEGSSMTMVIGVVRRLAMWVLNTSRAATVHRIGKGRRPEGRRLESRQVTMRPRMRASSA